MFQNFSIPEHHLVHEAAKNRFVLTFPEDTEKNSIIEYAKSGEATFDLFHTEVPAKNRGQGIAKILTLQTVEAIFKEKPDVSLNSTFVVARSPEVRPVRRVSQEWRVS